MMTSTMAKIKDMIDVNTVIGDPITTPDGVTIIPVTKGLHWLRLRRPDFA